MPKVETAALLTQTLQAAPATVTVITRQEIRRCGYRTLAEVLAGVRGFYVTSDGVLSYLGVRGFSLPGDYNTRILVMINGHTMTDNVYGSMYMFGQDFGLDLDLIERIEVVRGPSSALYGSNGVFATINIFTRLPIEASRGYVSTEFGSFGEKKVTLSSSSKVGRNGNLLVSASGYDFAGRTVLVPGLADSTPTGGWTGHVENQHGYHAFAQLTWGGWSLSANLADRKELAPAGWYSSTFGDTGTSSRDGRGFVELAWNRSVGKAATLSWRLSYDRYRYTGSYAYSEDGNMADRGIDRSMGDWVGSRLSLHTNIPQIGRLIVGGEANTDLRNQEQYYYTDQPAEMLVNVSARNSTYGVFAQQEVELASRWTLYLGARVDASRLYKASVTPRFALVYQPSGRTAVKLIYGKAFRNPSTFERFWEPSPTVRPERMDTIELALEQSIGRKVDVTVSAYRSRLGGLIEGVLVGDATLQYRNVSDAGAKGVEFGMRGRPWEWLEASTGVSFQRSEYDQRTRDMPNSPARLAFARAAVPLFRRHLFIAPAGIYVGARRTLFESTLPGTLVLDCTASTQGLGSGFDVVFGVKNLTDRRYFDPLSQEHLSQVMPRQGRSFFVKIIWQRAD
jgi:iron complex outermembrane receptor protein